MVYLGNWNAIRLGVPAIAVAEEVEPHHRMHDADHGRGYEGGAATIERVGHE